MHSAWLRNAEHEGADGPSCQHDRRHANEQCGKGYKRVACKHPPSKERDDAGEDQHRAKDVEVSLQYEKDEGEVRGLAPGRRVQRDSQCVAHPALRLSVVASASRPSKASSCTVGLGCISMAAR